MNGQHVEENATSRQRLRALVARLDDAALQRQIDAEWTVGAALAHLAFWDQSCVARWHEFAEHGTMVGFSGEAIDLINAASLPLWRALPGRAAAELALQAAAAADARAAAAPDAALAYIAESGRTLLLDRARHRNAHLDQIEHLLR